MKTALFALGPIGLLAVRLSAQCQAIGATAPDPRLTVKGNIHAREVKVAIGTGADFVFGENYNLPAFEDLAGFTKANKRLPGTAPEREVRANGLHLAGMGMKLLQKMEGPALYAIQREKRPAQRERANQEPEAENREAKGRLGRTEKPLGANKTSR